MEPPNGSGDRVDDPLIGHKDQNEHMNRVPCFVFVESSKEKVLLNR
jgi:hypothetical protein